MSGSRDPNVLLVVLDGVRAGNTSLHGHDNRTTPFLGTYADRATDYRQARSPGTESISSHTSVFTGLHVREHGITHRGKRLRAGETVWEALAEDGYDTAVFSNNPFLTELPVGLSEAFDHVVGRAEELPFPDAVNPKEFVIDGGEGPAKYLRYLRASVESGNVLGSLWNGASFKLGDGYEGRLPPALQSDDSAAVYGGRFLDWVADRSGPWAACVNFMDAHYPYAPGPFDEWGGDHLRRLQASIDDQAWEFVGGRRPWGERRAIEALYDGAVRRMDDQLETVVETLDRRGILDETLVVVTADHGEGFGERSRVRPDQSVVGHGNGSLHDCLLHVPLVVDFPGDGAGDTVADVATLTRFPSLVESVRRGERDPGAFLPPDGVVRASTDGIDPDSQERAREFAGDVSVRTLGADARYTGRGTDVQKAVVWGDRSATVAVRDARNAWVEGPTAETDGDARAAVESAFAGLEDAGVAADSGAPVDDDVKRRLEDLGYA
jgi:arylsulfatase